MCMLNAKTLCVNYQGPCDRIRTRKQSSATQQRNESQHSFIHTRHIKFSERSAAQHSSTQFGMDERVSALPSPPSQTTHAEARLYTRLLTDHDKKMW